MKDKRLPRIWKPLDIGGLRLYRVSTTKNGKPYGDDIVAAKSPRAAAAIIEQSFSPGSGYYISSGWALNVNQPAEWWEDGVPCCKGEATRSNLRRDP